MRRSAFPPEMKCMNTQLPPTPLHRSPALLSIRYAKWMCSACIEKIWISFPISDIPWHFSMRAVSMKCETYNEMPSDILTRSYVRLPYACVRTSGYHGVRASLSQVVIRDVLFSIRTNFLVHPLRKAQNFSTQIWTQIVRDYLKIFLPKSFFHRSHDQILSVLHASVSLKVLN